MFLLSWGGSASAPAACSGRPTAAGVASDIPTANVSGAANNRTRLPIPYPVPRDVPPVGFPLDSFTAISSVSILFWGRAHLARRHIAAHVRRSAFAERVLSVGIRRAAVFL